MTLVAESKVARAHKKIFFSIIYDILRIIFWFRANRSRYECNAQVFLLVVFSLDFLGRKNLPQCQQGAND